MSKKKPQLTNSKDGYDLYAQFYDTKARFLNSFEPGDLFQYLEDFKGKKILDAGAGTGRLSIKLAKQGADVTALDISSEILKILKSKNGRIKTVVGSVEYMPFEDESFDIVLAIFLIVHLKNPRIFFEEVYRVLKPGGIFLVSNINQKDPPILPTKQGNIIIQSYYHSPKNLKDQLKQLALEITHEEMIREKDVWINQILVCKK